MGIENEREKPLLTKGKRQKVVRFLISPKKKKVKIEVNERKELKKIRIKNMNSSKDYQKIENEDKKDEEF